MRLLTEFVRERVLYICANKSLCIPDAPLRVEMEHCVDKNVLRLKWGRHRMERSWPDSRHPSLDAESIYCEVAEEFADAIDKEQNSDKWAVPSV